MKKRYKIIQFAVIALLCGTTLFSCKKDKQDTTDLLAYIKSTYVGSPNAAPLNVVITPLGVVNDSISAAITGSLTRPFTQNVSINLAVDGSKVAAYNHANKTSFTLAPSASYTIVGSTAMSIKAGSAISPDSIKVRITDGTKLTDTNGYVLPISITNVSGGGNASSNFGTVYIVFHVSTSNVNAANVIPAGTAISRVGWTATVTSTYSGYPAANLLDGDYTTYWGSNRLTLPQSVTIDMGKSNTLKGLTYGTGLGYRGRSDFAPSQMMVYTSTDGTNWVKQGPYVGPDSGQGVVDGIKFYAPVTARYFMLSMTGAYDSTYPSWVGFSEINAIQ